MFEFMRVAKDSYVLYKNGIRVTPIPLTKEELHQKILELDVSESEERFINKFYGGEADGKRKEAEKTEN